MTKQVPKIAQNTRLPPVRGVPRNAPQYPTMPIFCPHFGAKKTGAQSSGYIFRQMPKSFDYSAAAAASSAGAAASSAGAAASPVAVVSAAASSVASAFASSVASAFTSSVASAFTSSVASTFATSSVAASGAAFGPQAVIANIANMIKRAASFFMRFFLKSDKHTHNYICNNANAITIAQGFPKIPSRFCRIYYLTHGVKKYHACRFSKKCTFLNIFE